MTWGFRGGFFGPLKASDWTERFSSQANPETLNHSGIEVLVVSLYAHPLFVFSLRDSVRRQIDLAERFVRENPRWIIARTAGEAKAAIAAGKKVMILSVEGASSIIETDEDIREFVDERGVRIVTFLHLTDDQLGGVAFLRGLPVLSSPFAWIKSLIAPKREEGVRVNDRGYSPQGRELARKLLRRKVWIDLAHSSDRSQDDFLALLKEEKLDQPLLFTHTSMRKYHGAERGISDDQLKRVAASGGIVGLMPSEQMLDGTPADPCAESLPALVRQYREVAAVVGARSIAMGSDYNGGVPHLKPSCLKTGTSLDTQGLWNIGQVGDLWAALEKAGAPVPHPLSQSVEAFLDAWARVNP